ncbi:uncharacterized protein LOC126193002 [Schistocerca nitens]|uniref:uncharacterized protein LOC126193002 n=1 Tax=Schistocerca nitens TaxID=7011 RepID=UPI0021174CBB|nr:uncharacterized protein LOC126193002 [Schistocerca nitens]
MPLPQSDADDEPVPCSPARVSSSLSSDNAGRLLASALAAAAELGMTCRGSPCKQPAFHLSANAAGRRSPDKGKYAAGSGVAPQNELEAASNCRTLRSGAAAVAGTPPPAAGNGRPAACEVSAAAPPARGQDPAGAPVDIGQRRGELSLGACGEHARPAVCASPRNTDAARCSRVGAAGVVWSTSSAALGPVLSANA